MAKPTSKKLIQLYPALSKYEKATRSSLAYQLDKCREKCLAILMIKYTKNSAFSVLQHYRRTIVFGKEAVLNWVNLQLPMNQV
ncbi:MAG: hypothetical protein MJE68_20890 [Proteobacteria bacterium]|nr:hypothetical protein [Pseudomonadota bacterium]